MTHFTDKSFGYMNRLLKSAGRISDDWPPAKTLTVLWLLCERVLNIDFDSQA